MVAIYHSAIFQGTLFFNSIFLSLHNSYTRIFMNESWWKNLLYFLKFNFDQTQLKSFVFTLIQSEPKMLMRRKLCKQEFYSVCSTINIKRVLFYVINKEQSEWLFKKHYKLLFKTFSWNVFKYPYWWRKTELLLCLLYVKITCF